MQLVLLAQRPCDRNVVHRMRTSVEDTRYFLGIHFNSGKVQIRGELELIILYIMYVQEIVRRIDLVHRLDEHKLQKHYMMWVKAIVRYLTPTLSVRE